MSFRRTNSSDERFSLPTWNDRELRNTQKWYRSMGWINFVHIFTLSMLDRYTMGSRFGSIWAQDHHPYRLDQYHDYDACMGLLDISADGYCGKRARWSRLGERGHFKNHSGWAVPLESELRQRIRLRFGCGCILTLEKELQPRAFSIMPLVFTIGAIFGPVILLYASSISLDYNALTMSMV